MTADQNYLSQKSFLPISMSALKAWFEEEKRDLPWRISPTPYQVWISEVMLQQTQVAVVLPYYKRWMKRFPSIASLASATLEEVIKLWEGLGYYSRARYLHEGAKKIVSDFGGQIPQERQLLEQIKGFGPYTVGAVLSFAFHQKAAAVDGNVQRVISRLFCLTEEVSNKKPFEAAALACLPDHEPWVVMEGLIELGARICQKKPQCSRCPLQEQCLAYRQGLASTLPVKKKKPEAIAIFRDVAVISDGQAVLVRQEKLGKVMGGLYEFPYRAREKISQEAWPFEFKVTERQALSIVKHGFTKYRATLYPALWKIEEKKEFEGFEWVSWDQLSSLPFSSGHRRILKEVISLFAEVK